MRHQFNHEATSDAVETTAASKLLTHSVSVMVSAFRRQSIRAEAAAVESAIAMAVPAEIAPLIMLLANLVAIAGVATTLMYRPDAVQSSYVAEGPVADIMVDCENLVYRVGTSQIRRGCSDFNSV
jgi:hypothetical protein